MNHIIDAVIWRAVSYTRKMSDSAATCSPKIAILAAILSFPDQAPQARHGDDVGHGKRECMELEKVKDKIQSYRRELSA